MGTISLVRMTAANKLAAVRYNLEINEDSLGTRTSIKLPRYSDLEGGTATFKDALNEIFPNNRYEGLKIDDPQVGVTQDGESQGRCSRGFRTRLIDDPASRVVSLH